MSYLHSFLSAGQTSEPIERVSDIWIAPDTIDVDVKPQPEGHLLATSKAVPGLIVEGDTLQQIMEEVEAAAPLLWELERGTQFDARIRYIRHRRP